MDVFEDLLRFCSELDRRRMRYDLLHVRPETVMVAVTVPGERWEVEFFADGRREVERFVSQGVVDGATAPDDVLALFEA